MPPHLQATTIRGSAQYKYCPVCGSQTETETFSVGTYRRNQRTVCPNHGELIHR